MKIFDLEDRVSGIKASLKHESFIKKKSSGISDFRFRETGFSFNEKRYRLGSGKGVFHHSFKSFLNLFMIFTKDKSPWNDQGFGLMLTCFAILYLIPSSLAITNDDHLNSHINQINTSPSPAALALQKSDTFSLDKKIKIEKSEELHFKSEGGAKYIHFYNGSAPTIKPGSVRLAVIAPSDPKHDQSLVKILPSIQLAVRAVSDRDTGALPGWDIHVDYRDSNCSSVYGPLAAFEFYINKSAGEYYTLSLYDGGSKVHDVRILIPLFIQLKI